jgi:hypothetical protein
MRDRASANAIALLFASLLLLQGLLSGLGQGSMAAAAMDPLNAICSSVGTPSAHDHGDDSAPGKKAIDCPCCALCRLASAMPALLSAESDLAHVEAEIAIIRPVPVALQIPHILRGLIAEPRAPPVVS